ncbi:MAG: DUF3311 domain-containing protein [Planctomycetota bacterium]|jgi:hypothetical protein
MKGIIIALIILLSLLHQDFWWWDDGSTVFGFLPIGLAYHAGISIAAGLLWALAIKYCWPASLEQIDDAPQDATGVDGGGA